MVEDARKAMIVTSTTERGAITLLRRSTILKAEMNFCTPNDGDQVGSRNPEIGYTLGFSIFGCLDEDRPAILILLIYE